MREQLLMSQWRRRLRSGGDGGHEGGRGAGGHTVDKSPHHSLGNKPAVYGQLLICWVIIPFYPQLNQQQNKTLHKRRQAPPQHSTQRRKRERQTDRGEVKCARVTPVTEKEGRGEGGKKENGERIIP